MPQPIMQARNPTAKEILKNTPRLHRRVTQNNTPRGLPLIKRTHLIPTSNTPGPPSQMDPTTPRQQHLPGTQPNAALPPTTLWSLPTKARQHIIMQQVINVLTIHEQATFYAIFTPCTLMQHAVIPCTHHFKHYANPMVHPVTGESIPSYKNLMCNPPTAEIWQTIFVKGFGAMAQGDNKTG